MILSTLFTILTIFLLYLSVKTAGISFRFKPIFQLIQATLQRQKEPDYPIKVQVLIVSFFSCFLLLPLVWGLSFYLLSDANILVVIFTMVWAYNWIKYSVLPPEPKKK